jgi:hypothetical protein
LIPKWNDFRITYNRETDKDLLEYSICNNAFPFSSGEEDVLGPSFILANFGLHCILVWVQSKVEINASLRN